MSVGTIVLVIVGIVLFILVKSRLSNSSSIVVTGPGVRKIHDVECKFRSGAIYHGDLDQSGWSDGQERVEMNLRKLPGDYTGPVQMLHNGQHVADFEASNGLINFAWKGHSSADYPVFNIGDTVQLKIGLRTIEGIVEAD